MCQNVLLGPSPSWCSAALSARQTTSGARFRWPYGSPVSSPQTPSAPPLGGTRAAARRIYLSAHWTFRGPKPGCGACTAGPPITAWSSMHSVPNRSSTLVGPRPTPNSSWSVVNSSFTRRYRSSEAAQRARRCAGLAAVRPAAPAALAWAATVRMQPAAASRSAQRNGYALKTSQTGPRGGWTAQLVAVRSILASSPASRK